MFLSLQHQATKNQLPNIKCQPKFFAVFTISKEKRQPGLFLVLGVFILPADAMKETLYS